MVDAIRILACATVMVLGLVAARCLDRLIAKLVDKYDEYGSEDNDRID